MKKVINTALDLIVLISFVFIMVLLIVSFGRGISDEDWNRLEQERSQLMNTVLESPVDQQRVSQLDSINRLNFEIDSLKKEYEACLDAPN